MPEKSMRPGPRRVPMGVAFTGLSVSLAVSVAVSVTGARAGWLDLPDTGFTVAAVAAVAGQRNRHRAEAPAAAPADGVAEVEPLRRAA